MRVKMSKQPPPAPTARPVGPCPTLIQASRTPRHWKLSVPRKSVVRLTDMTLDVYCGRKTTMQQKMQF